ncbi:MAG TPA: PD-(D/E)XK nuclease family protein, partial [Candidatus Ozemobacteraceae bacterium]|nr:PD-(D/E)XK nuclease family protein [Candidatus Ozemobacteraceae bacterium]
GYRHIQQPALSLEKGLRWLSLILETKSFGEPFKPDGKVIITTLDAVPVSHRAICYFPGLSHQAMPGRQQPDPVLADHVRHLLPPLQTAERMRLERLGALAVCWAELPVSAQVCLSLSLSDRSGAALSPSGPFMKVLSEVHGNSVEFARLLNTDVLPMVGSLSETASEPLDVREWLWQASKNGVDTEHLRSLFDARFPLYKRFHVRQSERQQGTTPIHSGLPQWQAAEWDYRDNPNRALSASGISELSGCPFAVFLSRVLRCMPYEQLTTVPLSETGWLDAMQRGNVLHEVYETFLRRAGWPIISQHETLLKQVLEETTEKYRALIPPPSPVIFQSVKADLLRDVLAFFKLECAAAASGRKPIGFEVSFGMSLPEGKADDLGLNTAEPVELPLPDGRKVYLKGRIDRIDEGPNGLEVWDYKTGSATSYGSGGERAGDARVQMALYQY